MLRIKEEVDLKELEKYGFKYQKSPQEHYLLQDEINYMYVIEKYRKIYLAQYSAMNPLVLNKIYDLINDGLVEKVSDEE